MGKRYYCEYCDKTMNSSPAIVKKHNQGLVHQKLLHAHYQQFKDPETILSEESGKKICNRFFKGECQFGAVCHFSHYSQEQIDEFKQLVEARNIKSLDITVSSFQDLYEKIQSDKEVKSKNCEEDATMVYDNNGVTHILPWTYNIEFEHYNPLPPSLKRITVDDFVNIEISEWG